MAPDPLQRLAEQPVRSNLRKETKNLRFLALGFGAAAAALSIVIGGYSYRVSYRMQLDAAARTNISLVRHLAHAVDRTTNARPGNPPLTARERIDRVQQQWAALSRGDPSMYFCVISREGKLLANGREPEKVGSNVSGTLLPAINSGRATTLRKLVASGDSWAGEMRDSEGQRQLIACEYSPTLDAMVVVHTPASSYVTRLQEAAWPWVIGFVASTLLLWPLGMFLLNIAYDRAIRRAEYAEHLGKRSELLFEAIFEQAAVGVALIHTESGRFARINGKFESLVGYTNGEITSKTWQEITHPDDLQSGVARMARLRKGELGEYSTQKRLIRGDGHTIWVKLTVSPSWRHGEHCNYHIAVIEDITESRRAAMELAESERRFRTLVENAPEAIVVFDVDQQRFVDFNENALRLFAVSASEMAQLSPIATSPEFQADGRRSEKVAKELIQRAIDGETPSQDWLHCDSHGNEVTCELRLVKLPASGQTLIRGSLTDIRERKRVEAKLQQHQEELAHVSRLSVMGEMVAGIAHEINQPLFAISNYAHTCGRLLHNEVLTKPEVLEWCGEIEREATRAAEIIRSLRTFTQKGELRHAPVDVNEAVRETIALLALDSRQRQVTLQIELSEDVGMIQGDLIGLQQVLVNLLRNAYESVEASDVDQRVVTVTTKCREPFVEIIVMDNGAGFPEGDDKRAFHAFFSTKTGGMGMGLAISRTLIEAHGGTLTAVNRNGGGAILCITLPKLRGVTPHDVACSHA